MGPAVPGGDKFLAAEFTLGTFLVERRSKIIWEMPGVKNSKMKESTEGRLKERGGIQDSVPMLSCDADQTQTANCKMGNSSRGGPGEGGGTKINNNTPEEKTRMT